MPDGPDLENEKRSAAEAAAALVEPGQIVGLGTGSTVAYLLPALAERNLDIRCVATSHATESEARRLGLDVRDFDGIDKLDIAIDGADQVAPDRWLIKGGGGAHTREKVVAAAASRFVVIVSSDKIVGHLHDPIPLEILAFGADATIRRLPGAVLRPATPKSPDGGLIADWCEHLDSTTAIDDPSAIAARLEAVAGVVDHGLFPPALVTDVIIGRGGTVEHRA